MSVDEDVVAVERETGGEVIEVEVEIETSEIDEEVDQERRVLKIMDLWDEAKVPVEISKSVQKKGNVAEVGATRELYNNN